jgi:dTMP kinase
MHTTKIIVIDGGENVGKATQADMLVNRLMNDGWLVGKMDFPRYSQNTLGNFIQECLDDTNNVLKDLNPKIVATLYAADRFEAKKQIDEWVAEGRVIVFDRYVSANMLHQGAKIAEADAREEFFKWVEHLEYDIFGMPRPDLTIYLDIPPEESQKLLQYIEDFGVAVVDPEGQAKMHQVKVSKCAKFLALTHDKWQTVQCLTDGTLRTREDIHDEVYAIAAKHLGPVPVTVG